MTNMQPRHIRIFLSSPGDVADERGIALKVIDQLPYDPLLRGKVTLEVVAWDKKGAGVPMLATLTPQEAINQGLPKPSECDIVVVIFWSRMGTPLPPEYVKEDGSRYLSGTEWEYEDAVKAARRSTEQPTRPQVVVYRRTENVLLSPADSDFMPKYEQWQRVQDFFKAFTNPDGSIQQGHNSYLLPEDFREQFDNHLRHLLQRLLDVPRQTITIPVQPPAMPAPELWKGSPFPGLRAFTPDDAPIFFGRGRETDELIKRFADPACRFLTVVGASGSGKSSLVGAGLIPRLQTNAIEGSKDCLWLRFTPGGVGDDPFMALAVALSKTIAAVDKRWPRPRDLATLLATKPDLPETMVAEALTGQPTWSELLLFIDQFEELFTLVAERYRGPFVDWLDKAVQTPRLRAVATLRADFYHRCLDWPKLAARLNTGDYKLSIPGYGALYEMIARPAARAGLAFEDGLVERILSDTGTDPGALALMAYTLDELYHACQRDSAERLTLAAYEALGGVQGAIGTRAKHVFDALEPEVQAALPTVFRELVSVDERGVATRQRAMLNRMVGDDQTPAAKLVMALTDARLLVQSRGVGDWPVVEVAHEALLRSWPRLATWIAEAQEDLILLRQVRSAADDWARKGQPDFLRWPAERLKLVYEMIERQRPAWSESERGFIEPEQTRLLREIDNIHTDHKRRRWIGERLATIGDTRSGIGVDKTGLPQIDWLLVEPGGRIEIEGQSFTVQPFYVAKYLVTFAQFQAFIDAPNGFENDRWWQGLPAVYTKQKMKPAAQQYDNYPRDSVSWYQAVAFVRWLDANYRQYDLFRQFPASNWQVRLPLESEWQWMAQNGKEGREYPWGVWDKHPRANTTEAGIGDRATAVGMYPAGATDSGVLDVAGNLWEWCLNKYGRAGKHLIDASEDTRVLRGGSFNDNQSFATCASRYSLIPRHGSSRFGLRVVVGVLY